MNSGSAHVTLLRTKHLVEDFRKEMGFKTFSEALRFIVEDYFKLRSKLDQTRYADFEKMSDLIAGTGSNDFEGAVIEELTELKQAVSEIKNMLVIVSQIDPKWLGLFQKYFPKYFK